MQVLFHRNYRYAWEIVMTATRGPASPTEVFFSYAHKDEIYKEELLAHLTSLRREKVITAWHDRMIGAGTEWEGQIDAHLKSAQVILLLISPDFMASDYCNDVEVAEAMRRHEAGEARVIPISVRPVDAAGAPFLKLQGLPKDFKPVSTWSNRDEAWLDVARGIRRAVEAFTSHPR
jgi:hypothetical protein